MDEQTRYRATGSLFLLALAIVCLPMLFDGKGNPPMHIEPLDVPATDPEVPEMSSVAPAADLASRVAELKAQVDDEGFYTASGARVGEPVLTEPDDSTRIWAVQVASFEDPARARALRDELRGLGYEAFLSTVRQNDNVLNRVAVGPLLSESDAESLRDTLSLEVEENARLMAFSN
jgi:DedD protein